MRFLENHAALIWNRSDFCHEEHKKTTKRVPGIFVSFCAFAGNLSRAGWLLHDWDRSRSQLVLDGRGLRPALTTL